MIGKHKLLLITPYIPYPLFEGGRVAQYGVIDFMRHSFDITLVVVARNNEDVNSINELKGKWNNVVIEVINLLPPIQTESKKTKILNAARRTYKRISKKNKAEGHETYSEFENSFFINIEVVKDRSFLLQLDSILKKTTYDLVQIDFVDFIDLVHCIPVAIPKVFVEIEIRYARLDSYAKTLGRKPDAYESYILKKVKQEELSLLKLYDGVIALSNDDKRKLDQHLEPGFVISSPFPVMDDQFRKPAIEKLKINKLVILGGEDHYPNKDAFEWFVNELQPTMKPSAQLPVHVVGKWKSETKELYADKKHIHFAGFVDDLISYCENSILIVSIRIGSGIRTKILYGMAQGTPIISTSLGCEGLPVTNQKELWIANNAKEFEAAIQTIAESPEKALKVVTEAQKLVKQEFSQSAVADIRGKYFNNLIGASKGAARASY